MLSASRPVRPIRDPFSAATPFWNSDSMAAISAAMSGRIPSLCWAACSRSPRSILVAALLAASMRKIAQAMSATTITAVTAMAGHSGMLSWKTRTNAQASAMKTAAKMYFSIWSPQ